MSDIAVPVLEESTVELVPAPATAEPSLRSRAIRGSVWTMVGYGSSNVLRLGSNLILTRLLFPETYGKMALVGIFLQGLQMFSDVGIGPSIIQNKRGEDPNFLNTAWTMQVMRGFAIFICSCLVAWPVSRLYSQPELIMLMPVVGLTAIIGGFNSTSIFTLSRRIDLSKLTLLELSSQTMSIVVMVIVALFSPTVWALVAGNIASSVMRLIASHCLESGPKNRLMWDKECAQTLMKFGRWIFVSTVLTFFAGQADRLIFGMQIPIAALGVYGIAVMMAGLPTQAIIKIAGPVTFSVYSRVGKERSVDQFGGVFGQIRYPILIFGGLAVTGLIVTGPALIYGLYDHRYHEAGWMLQMLVISAWFEILETTNGSAVLALGRPGWIATGNAAKLIGLVTFIPLGHLIGAHYGQPFRGMMVGLILSETLRYATSAIAIHRQGFGSIKQDMTITGLAALIAAGSLLIEHELKKVFPGVWTPAIAAAGCLCIVWAPLVWRAYRTVIPKKASIPSPVLAVAS